MARIVLIITLALSLVSTATAQEATPEEAASQLFEAFRAVDFDQAAKHMHPDALEQLQSMVTEIVSLDDSGMAATMFTGESDPDVIASLSPQEGFSRFMNGIVSIQPEMAEMFEELDFEIIGHVTEGDSLAHVVTRSHASVRDVRIQQTEVVSVKRYGDGWLALLSGDISNMTERLRAQFREEAQTGKVNP